MFLVEVKSIYYNFNSEINYFDRNTNKHILVLGSQKAD